MRTDKTEYYNKIYQERGFQGVIRQVELDLHIGRIQWKPNGIVKISTGGGSDDEEILLSLTSFLSRFGHNHYVGELRGGAFYFAEHLECSTGAFEIIEKLPDKETCNPKICRWCKYSSNGMRDPARSISMCDGCRYNEEFEHL